MEDLDFLELGNRRGDERFKLDVPVTANGFEAKILNLSENGIRFVTSDDVAGDEISLVLGAGSNQLRLTGRRVWSEKVGPGHSAIGVTFAEGDDLEQFRFLLSQNPGE